MLYKEHTLLNHPLIVFTLQEQNEQKKIKRTVNVAETAQSSSIKKTFLNKQPEINAVNECNDFKYEKKTASKIGRNSLILNSILRF